MDIAEAIRTAATERGLSADVLAAALANDIDRYAAQAARNAAKQQLIDNIAAATEAEADAKRARIDAIRAGVASGLLQTEAAAAARCSKQWVNQLVRSDR